MADPTTETPEQTETEAWLEKIGTKFVEVRFWIPKATGWFNERHVADPETIETTVRMTAERVGARVAIMERAGMWQAFWPFKPTNRWRQFPSQEAAEMFAIHRG